MKPGRELDKLIARKVLKLKDEHGFFIELDCPHYSTDIKAAWEIVDKLGEHPGYYDLYLAGHSTQWRARFEEQDTHTAKGETPAHAICLAALKAVGVRI